MAALYRIFDIKFISLSKYLQICRSLVKKCEQTASVEDTWDATLTTKSEHRIFVKTIIIEHF